MPINNIHACEHWTSQLFTNIIYCDGILLQYSEMIKHVGNV